MEPQVGHLAYRAGECARCGAALRESEPRAGSRPPHHRAGWNRLNPLLGSNYYGMPEPREESEVQTASRELAIRLVDWYRSTPTVWPMLVSRQRA